MLDFDSRKLYYNRCNPTESLAPDDDRNVDLDSLAGAGGGVRGVNWVERLAEQVELSNQPLCGLFTGLRGSGKTTELRRLCARLSRPDGANLLTVLVDPRDNMDLTAPIDIPDLMSALVHAGDQAVLAAEGRDPAQALEDGFLTRLWHWLEQTDVALGKGELAIPAAGKLVAELKTRPSFRQRVRETVSSHLTTFLRLASTEVSALDARVRRTGRAGMIIIFDQLETLRGSTDSWASVLASAERVFSSGMPYLRLPIHVLYTVPPALLTRVSSRSSSCR